MTHGDEAPASTSMGTAEGGQRRVSRRAAIGRGAALGLGASVSARVSGRRPGSAFAQESQPSESLPVPANVRTDLAGAKITAVLWPGVAVPGLGRALVATFQEATGIEVTVIEAPDGTVERLAFAYLPVLRAGSGDIDVLGIDVLWPGLLAEHALDLTPAMREHGLPHFDQIVQNNTVDGKLVGIPWFADAGLLYYRTDLLEKYGFAGPPVTWAELEAQATTIQAGERVSNPGFHGFVWQGAATEALTCDAFEWQVSQNGGAIIEADGTVSIDNENAAAAFQRARSWIGSISPEAATTFQEEETRAIWQAGNAAFLRNWPYAYALGRAANSGFNGRFAVTLLPKGESDGGRHACTLGGWELMVSRYSHNPEAAIEFAKYLTSPEVQKVQAVNADGLNYLPTIPALYDDPDVLEANPATAGLKPVFEHGAAARPSTIAAGAYDALSRAYYAAVHQVLVGEIAAADAMARLATEVSAILRAPAESTP